MIEYNEELKLFHLTTPKTSYVFRIFGEGVLEHLYYGKKLVGLDGMAPCNYGIYVNGSPVDSEYADMDSFVSTDIMLQEYGFYGSCDFRTPGFHASYSDGSRITKLKYVSHEIYCGKPKLKGLPATYTESDDEAQTLEILMKDELTGLIFKYRYTAFTYLDAITRNVEIVNSGENAVKIEKIMSCCIDFEDHDYDFIHLSGSWARERFIKREAIGQSRIQVESRRGSSSHHHSPFIALVGKNTDEKSGDVYGFTLA